MARLPVPGSDDNTWGNILNDFLSVELDSQGNLKRAADIQAAQTAANNAQATANAAQSGLSNKANTSAIVPISTIDSKGDLIVGTGNDAVNRLGVGADGQVLTADSTQGSGLKWAPLTGASALTWSSIITQPFVTDYGSPYSPLSAALDSNGIVHLRGLMGFTGTFSPVTTVAILPSVGMYPKARKLVMALDAQNTSAFLVMIINADGTITCVSPLDPGKVLSFDAITFDTQL